MKFYITLAASLILTLLSLDSAQAETIEFSFTLKPKGNICFLENIAETIQAVVEVKARSKNLGMSITDPRGKKMEQF